MSIFTNMPGSGDLTAVLHVYSVNTQIIPELQESKVTPTQGQAEGSTHYLFSPALFVPGSFHVYDPF